MKIGNRKSQRNYPEISSLVKDLANQIERKNMQIFNVKITYSSKLKLGQLNNKVLMTWKIDSRVAVGFESYRQVFTLMLGEQRNSDQGNTEKQK